MSPGNRLGTVVLIGLLGSMGCGSDPAARSPESALLSRVKDCVRRKIPAEQAEKFVGRAATISTLVAGDRERLGRACIDEERPTGNVSFDRGSAAHVMYWVWSQQEKNPRIVGIVWDANQGPRCFLGVVYPP